MKYFTLFFLALIMPVCSYAADITKKAKEPTKSTGFVYGLGLSISQEIYKGYNTRIIPLPLIGYKGEDLTVYGPFISYQLTEFNDLKVSIKLSPRFQGFDEKDSDIFLGMNERKNSIDVGVGVSYEKNNWKLDFSTLFDTLNRSNGFEVKSVVGHVFRFGPVFIEPSISLSLLDSDHVDYYYGVSTSEISQTRVVYSGSSSLNTSVGLSIATPMFLGGFTRMSIEYTHFDSAITNSPLVEDDTSFSFGLFFTKNF